MPQDRRADVACGVPVDEMHPFGLERLAPDRERLADADEAVVGNQDRSRVLLEREVPAGGDVRVPHRQEAPVGLAQRDDDLGREIGKVRGEMARLVQVETGSRNARTRRARRGTRSPRFRPAPPPLTPRAAPPSRRWSGRAGDGRGSSPPAANGFWPNPASHLDRVCRRAPAAAGGAGTRAGTRSCPSWRGRRGRRCALPLRLSRRASGAAPRRAPSRLQRRR